MHLFKPAARRRGRNTGLLLLSVLFLLVSLYSEAAFSASLMVTIKEINPAGGSQEATCADHKKCLLPLVIKTRQGQQETLNVTMFFVPGNILFMFHTPNGDLYASDGKADDKTSRYEAMWHIAPAKDKASTYNVTLFLPVVPHAAVAPILSVTHEAALKIAHEPVADLEISAQPVP
jgi:hypothetical protein